MIGRRIGIKEANSTRTAGIRAQRWYKSGKESETCGPSSGRTKSSFLSLSPFGSIFVMALGGQFSDVAARQRTQLKIAAILDFVSSIK